MHGTLHAKGREDVHPRRFLVSTIPALAATATIAIATAAQELPQTGFAVGEPFPTTAFPSLEDEHPMSVADYRGKRLILHIFASW